MNEMVIFVAMAVLVIVGLLTGIALLRLFWLAAEKSHRSLRVVSVACLLMMGVVATVPSIAKPWTDLVWYCPSQVGWKASDQELLEFISEANKEYDIRIKTLGACNDLSNNGMYIAWSPTIQPIKDVIGSSIISSPEFIDGMRTNFSQMMRVAVARSLEAAKQTFHNLYGVDPIINVQYSNDPEFFFGDNYFSIILQARFDIIIPGVYAAEQSIAVGRVMLKRAGQMFVSEINYTNDLSGKVTIYDLVDSFIANNTLLEYH